MRSMTGYGRGECILYNRKFVVEIKSVNHRYNDINIKMPRAMICYEDTIKKILSTQVFRGKTDVFISFETYSQNDIKITLNEILADSYVDSLKKIQQRYNVTDDISVALISKFPDVLTVEKNIGNADENEKDEIWETLSRAVNISLDNFVNMREIEGNTLKTSILDKLEDILRYVNTVEEKAPLAVKNYRQRLTDKLMELKEQNFDESRILTEVAIFSEKVCIDEEITRLYSHISQMRTILNEDIPVGRKLDFLVQEMNREVNTIGSKSNDIKITNCIVDMKSEIEKIREQIQNIE